MRVFPILIALVCIGTSLARSEEGWKKYTNARFGFELLYPEILVASREPDNGGGREFHTPDNAFSVVASAHFLIEGDSLEARWEEELRSLGKSITFKKKAATWYVVSGVTKDGIEFYHKFYAQQGNWAGFNITYPHARNKEFDPWVAKIEKSFVPFLKGDFDRIQ